MPRMAGQRTRSFWAGASHPLTVARYVGPNPPESQSKPSAHAKINHAGSLTGQINLGCVTHQAGPKCHTSSGTRHARATRRATRSRAISAGSLPLPEAVLPTPWHRAVLRSMGMARPVVDHRYSGEPSAYA